MSSTWIIDSGPFDHMTKDRDELQSLKPSSQPFISIANGGTSSSIGEGTVVITDNLKLDTVLVVPSLGHNLLFVSQITSFLNCTITFWPIFYIFQAIMTWGTLGYGV